MKLDRGTLMVGVIVTLTLLLFTGGAMALAQESGLSLADEVDDDESIAASNVSLSEEEAIDIATAEVNGTVEEVELESEDGTPVYEVEVVDSDGSEIEIVVHANDGTVLEIETEDEEDENENENEDGDNEESVAPDDVSLSEEEAINIATAEVNGTVEEVELESEDGTPVYEVEVVDSDGSEIEIVVHANDGTVLEIETEDE